MTDMRFIMIGLVTITVGFIVLGVFGEQYTEITVQTKEFSECYDYPEDQPPVKIECNSQVHDKNILFVIVIGIIAGGSIALFKGVKGSWDQDIKPGEMVGPGGENDGDDTTHKS